MTSKPEFSLFIRAKRDNLSKPANNEHSAVRKCMLRSVLTQTVINSVRNQGGRTAVKFQQLFCSHTSLK